MLFMLALLEVGAVALVLAVAILGFQVSSLDLARFAVGAPALPPSLQIGVGLLLLIGFGAKLGLLPFYEWFPGAYGSASGATGAILSGVVLNAAFFGLSRGLMSWLPPPPAEAFPVLAVIVIVGGDDQCDSHDPLRIPTGRLATASEPLFGRECFDRGRRARRVFALRELPTQRIGWLGMDGSSFAPGWACARERGALHDGRWPPPRQRDVRHHAERSRRSLVFWRRCATGCDESLRHAPDRGFRQRMVCLSDRVPGFSFA